MAASLDLGSRFIVIGMLIAAMWAVFVIDPAGHLHILGVKPRHEAGLIGIAAMPFLHGNTYHITSNTTKLAVLLAVIALTEPRFVLLVIALIVGSGGALWLFGPAGTNIIGASGLVFAAFGYLLTISVLSGNVLGLAASGAIAWHSWYTIVDGLTPTDGGIVSWEGHLAGLVAGAAVAIAWPGRK